MSNAYALFVELADDFYRAALDAASARRAFQSKSRRHLRKMASMTPWEMAVRTGQVREEER